MREIAFSIPVTGTIRIEDGSVTITVNTAQTKVELEPSIKSSARISLEQGKTMYDIVLETAREMVRELNKAQFSAADLYHRALRKHPALKRNSWNSHVIACAPDHPSYKHYTSKRDYLTYAQNGRYRLAYKYIVQDDSNISPISESLE